MSTFYPYRLKCVCGHVRVVDLVAGIHITRLPEARRQILDGTFQIFVCPSCEQATAVTAPAVYTDFDRHQYVAVETPHRRPWASVRSTHAQVFEDSFTSGPPIAAEMASRFVKRGVYGYPALQEKLIIWDSSLDDLVIEGVKGVLTERLGLGPEQVRFRLRALLPGGHLLFACYEPVVLADDREAVVRSTTSAPADFETVPASVYHEVRDCRHGLVDEYPWLGDDWLVDFHDASVDSLVMRQQERFAHRS